MRRKARASERKREGEKARHRETQRERQSERESAKEKVRERERARKSARARKFSGVSGGHPGFVLFAARTPRPAPGGRSVRAVKPRLYIAGSRWLPIREAARAFEPPPAAFDAPPQPDQVI